MDINTAISKSIMRGVMGEENEVPAGVTMDDADGTGPVDPGGPWLETPATAPGSTVSGGTLTLPAFGGLTNDTVLNLETGESYIIEFGANPSVNLIIQLGLGASQTLPAIGNTFTTHLIGTANTELKLTGNSGASILILPGDITITKV